MRELIERLRAEIKFSKTRIEALNFEVARLKRWRFGSSVESLDATTQAVLFEAHRDTGSEIAGQAVALIAKLYEIEREARDLTAQERQLVRLERSRPIALALHTWLVAKRQALARADATARAIDYSLSNWTALIHFLDDGNVPIDNNAAENAMRPLAVGRKNWLFVGSQQDGERASNILSLIESAKLNGHEPWAYLKDVFERLPTLKNRDLAQLLPHNCRTTGVDLRRTPPRRYPPPPRNALTTPSSAAQGCRSRNAYESLGP